MHASEAGGGGAGVKPPDRATLPSGGAMQAGARSGEEADELQVAGLACLGYPFHAAGRPDATRIAHLASLKTPALFVQGERDRLGSRREVAGYPLSPAIRLVWSADGDHDLAPRKTSGLTQAENLAAAAGVLAEFVRGRMSAAAQSSSRD